MPEISKEKNDAAAEMGVPAGKLPAHVAFIMDGNGRWARSRGLPRLEGHLRVALETVENAFRAGVRVVTLYAFSVENQKRPAEEIAGLMALLKNFLEEYLPTLLKNEIRLRVIGDLEWFPRELSETLGRVEAETAHFPTRVLVVALNYSSRDEVLRAVSAYAKAASAAGTLGEKPSWDAFSRHLDTAGIPDPDLIVRTSGELRLSNFLLLQAAYSELYFCEVLWPDFSFEELKKALVAYASRERRFGETGEQLAGTPAE